MLPEKASTSAAASRMKRSELVRSQWSEGDSNPRSFLQEQLVKCPFVDPGVVTRAVPVLDICADVLRDVTVLAPVEQWSLGYELRTGSSPASGSSVHDESPSARAAGATSRPGAARAGNAAMTGRIMKAPYRVVVPGDTPPHPRAGRGGNRRNAVLGFVALAATVIAAVTTVTAPSSPPAAPAPPPAAPPQHHRRSVAGESHHRVHSPTAGPANVYAGEKLSVQYEILAFPQLTGSDMYCTFYFDAAYEFSAT